MRILIARPLLGLAGALMTLVPTLGSASEAVVVTRHQIVGEDGRKISYRAETGRLEVKDDAGVVRGRFFYVAYRVAANGKKRPLIFVWNGGPGSNATTLHFYGFGPKRITSGQLVDNRDSLLAVSDLVFFDPMSTGYSRAPTEEEAKAFYGTLADIDWTARFVTTWRKLNKAESQPLFLLGESFGVPRATGAAERLADGEIPLRGVILISGGKIAVESALPKSLSDALAIPGKATAAFLAGKIDAPVGATARSIGEEAATWARDVYAPALARRPELSARERETIAEGLAKRLGVPPANIDRSTLVMTSRVFLETMIPGGRLHPFDMRRPMAPDPDKAVGDQLILAYLRSALGFATRDSYWSIEAGQPDVNALWKYTGGPEDFAAAMAGGGPPESRPWLSRAISKNPSLKAFVAVGIFDSQNSCAANEALRHIMPKAEAAAISTHCYWAGHAIFKDDEARGAISRDIADFVRESTR